MSENTPLISVAGIVIAFGVAVLVFRLRRELEMADKGERAWVAFSDWLVIIAMGVASLFVILPLLAGDSASSARLPRAAAALSVVLALGWVPSILAHYRLILGPSRTGPRHNPEPGELLVVFLSVLVGVAAFLVVFSLTKTD